MYGIEVNGEGHEENYRAIFYLQLIFLIATQSPLNMSIVINIRTPSAFLKLVCEFIYGKRYKVSIFTPLDNLPLWG